MLEFFSLKLSIACKCVDETLDSALNCLVLQSSIEC